MTSNLVSVLFSVLALSPAEANSDPHYCDSSGTCQKYFVAHSFTRPADLRPQQSDLLEAAGISDRIFNDDGTTTFGKWAMEHDDWAAAFFAVTHALALLEIDLGGGEKISALDLVSRVKRFEGDRIRVELFKPAVEKWQKSGGGFKFYRADGKHENGKLKLGRGGLGGSIHQGYDVQGYTSTSKVPRLQFNYRYSDSESDIDVDGYAPLIAGFIPNPSHLTYKNSDPRQWYNSLLKKMGNPGFNIRPH